MLSLAILDNEHSEPGTRGDAWCGAKRTADRRSRRSSGTCRPRSAPRCSRRRFRRSRASAYRPKGVVSRRNDGSSAMITVIDIASKTKHADRGRARDEPSSAHPRSGTRVEVAVRRGRTGQDVSRWLAATRPGRLRARGQRRDAHAHERAATTANTRRSDARASIWNLARKRPSPRPATPLRCCSSRCRSTPASRRATSRRPATSSRSRSSDRSSTRSASASARSGSTRKPDCPTRGTCSSAACSTRRTRIRRGTCTTRRRRARSRRSTST